MLPNNQDPGTNSQQQPEHTSGDYITVCRLKGSRTTAHPLVEDSDSLFDEKTAQTEWVKGVRPGSLLFPIGRQHFWIRFKDHAQLIDLLQVP
jgi:hypothetical protein